MFDNDELLGILDKLISNWENEVVEFKEANNDFDKDKIGQYFSAISNESNLHNLQFGWLVFGVRNKDRVVIGTKYRDNGGLMKLKQEISLHTTGALSFIEIYEVYKNDDNKTLRVLMMQIPAAVAGIPTAWKEHYYGRNGESLGALSLGEMERIRRQQNRDWSKQIVLNANIKHLDKNAIEIARKNYKEKMNKSHISEAVDEMRDEEFLTKLKLLQDGKVTNAAMLLLGNEDYDYLFNYTPEASWRLLDSKGDVKDYEIFKVPFITLSDRIFGKIRNLTYRYMTNPNSLFPSETKQYDNWLLRELLNNCIAHSNYEICSRIILDEEEDQVIFKNPGTFLPGTIEKAIEKNYNAPFYRNQLLAETMVKLNMIDTQSMGIRKVYRIQKDKFFPMPDYDLSEFNQVNVTVYGKVLNDNYTKVLFEHPEFDIETVYLIDKVQKGHPISKDAIKHLRKLKVIEGRQPNIYISATLADILDKKEQYVKHKAFDEDAYQKWIISYLESYGKAKRKDIIKLLDDKLPDTLSTSQKTYKVKYILSKMRDEGLIKLDSDNKRLANWVLVK